MSRGASLAAPAIGSLAALDEADPRRSSGAIEAFRVTAIAARKAGS